MAETTTMTLDARVAARTRPAAWSMRSAPRRELPPNLKATRFLRCLLAPPAQCTCSCNAARLPSAADSSCTFSRLMTCAPGFPRRFQPLERLWRGLKRRNPPPGSLLAVGWKLFASLLAVSPRAGSGNSRLSRSRGNRHGRLGRNSLGGDRQHYERKNSTGEDGSEGKFWRGRRGRCKRSPRPFYRFSLSPGEQFCGRNACPMEKVQTLASGISWVSAHKPAEFVFAKRRLEQVRPDSAFWSSEMSMEVTWKPRASMRVRVRGNDAGKMIVSARARALAACGSAGSTSIHSWPASGVVSNQARFARSVLRPRYVTADFR